MVISARKCRPSRTRRQRRKEIGNSNQIQRFVQNVRFYPRVRKGNTLQNLYNVLLGKAYIEEAEHLRYNDEIKQIYAKRKETIERVFADAKENDGQPYEVLKRSLCRRCLRLLP